jgi:hypothetical protein
MGFVFERVPEDKREEYGLELSKRYSFLWVVNSENDMFLIDKGISRENIASFEFYYKGKNVHLYVGLDYSVKGKLWYHIPKIPLETLEYDNGKWKVCFVEALSKYHESMNFLREKEMKVKIRKIEEK